MRNCCVCFEEDTHGVVCLSDHLTCKECFPTYVKSCYENGAKFRDQGFTIRCPYPECSSSPFNMSELRMNLPDSIIEKLFDTMIYYNNLKASFERSCTVQERLLDAMNLKCPNCRTVSDPNPDGCCAVRCPTCSTHFCWLCLQECSDSSNCHIHVVLCHLNPSRDVFAPRAVVEAAHKHCRIKQIQAVLRAVHSHDGYSLDWKSTNQTQTLLNECSEALTMNGVTPYLILATNIDDQLYSFPDVFHWLNANRNYLEIVALLAYLVSMYYVLSTAQDDNSPLGMPVYHFILSQCCQFVVLLIKLVPTKYVPSVVQMLDSCLNKISTSLVFYHGFRSVDSLIIISNSQYFGWLVCGSAAVVLQCALLFALFFWCRTLIKISVKEGASIALMMASIVNHFVEVVRLSKGDNCLLVSGTVMTWYCAALFIHLLKKSDSMSIRLMQVLLSCLAFEFVAMAVGGFFASILQL